MTTIIGMGIHGKRMMIKEDDFEYSEDWESNYFEVQKLLGEEINKLQNRVLTLASENRKLKADNFQLKHRKRK